MTLATGMSLAATATGCMKLEETDHLCNLRNHVAPTCPQVLASLEEESDKHGCFNNERMLYYSDMMKGTSFPVEGKSYSASFHPLCNEWLAFWLFLVASSYFFLSKNVNSFLNYRIKKHAEKKVSSPDRTSPSTPARIENGEEAALKSMFSCSEPSHTVSSKCDTYSDISDFDRTRYMDSLLSLEEEDSEWLSDSKPYGYSNENPSTPTSYKCDSFSEVSDLDSPNYWDSLLKLDSEWISDSNQELHSVQDSFHTLSYRRYNNWGVEVLPLISTTSSLTGVCSVRSEDDSISVENLLETADIDEFSADEPLFWPFEGELDWDSGDSWSSFCSSPRKRLVYDSGSATSMMEECKEKVDDYDKDACSVVKSETSGSSMSSKRSSEMVVKILFNEDYVPSKDDLLLGREYYDALDQELPIETLMGLREFDGHEGLDSEELNGDVFMMDEFYSFT